MQYNWIMNGICIFNITISREFGCNPREISRILVSKLGAELYDKDLVDMAAERAGISLDVFMNADKSEKTAEIIYQIA